MLSLSLPQNLRHSVCSEYSKGILKRSTNDRQMIFHACSRTEIEISFDCRPIRDLVAL